MRKCSRSRSRLDGRPRRTGDADGRGAFGCIPACGQEVIPQVWAALTAGGAGPVGDLPQERVQELDTRGLIIPSANLAV